MNPDPFVRPFQFGISTLLVVTTMYAALFSVLRALSLPPVVFAETAIFLTAIGLGQRFLFKGRRPIMVSIVIGTCLGLGFLFLHRALGDTFGRTVAVWESDDGRTVAYFELGNPIQGAIDGYVFGVFIAGGFLVVSELKSRLKLHA